MTIVLCAAGVGDTTDPLNVATRLNIMLSTRRSAKIAMMICMRRCARCFDRFAMTAPSNCVNAHDYTTPNSRPSISPQTPKARRERGVLITYLTQFATLVIPA